MYAALLGRFCSRDPIGYEGDYHNLYRYVMNGCTNRTDPSGLDFPVIPPWPYDPDPLCALALKQKGLVPSDVGGALVCEDGKPHACVFPQAYSGVTQPEIIKMIKTCSREHELEHIKQGIVCPNPCPSTLSLGKPKGDRIDSECYAYTKTLECVGRFRNVCGGRKECEEAYDEYRMWAIRHYESYCISKVDPPY